MMLVWKGWGILVLLIPLLFIITVEIFGEALIGGDTLSDYVIGCNLLLSAVICFVLGRKLNDPSKDKELVDPETGETHIHKVRHSFFWIPMQWWSIVMALLGLMLFFVD